MAWGFLLWPDWLVGDAGDNELIGGSGTSFIFGRRGNDTLLGGEGGDYLIGGRGHDSLDGGPGNDVLFGGKGHDILVGGEGKDTLLGGHGNDVFIGTGGDRFIGGRGRDTVDYSALPAVSRVEVDLTAGTTLVLNPVVNYFSILDENFQVDTEHFLSSFFDGAGVDPDTGLVYMTQGGTDGLVRIDPTDGTQVTIGFAGRSLSDVDFLSDGTLLGVIGRGDGTAPGGVVTVDKADASATLLSDPIDFGGLTGIAIVRVDDGDPATDTVYGSTISDASPRSSTLVTLDPETGALIGQPIPITVDGEPLAIGDLAYDATTGELYGTGAGANVSEFDSVNSVYLIDVVTGEASLVDEVDGRRFNGGFAIAPDGTAYHMGFEREPDFDTFSSVENAVGTSFGDRLFGNSIANVLDGGAGNDTIDGGAGNDTIIGGEGNDAMTGAADADTFVFVGTIGLDRIFDFETGIDKLQIDAGFGFATAEDVAAAAIVAGADVIVDLGGGNQVTLFDYLTGGTTIDNLAGDIVIM